MKKIIIDSFKIDDTITTDVVEVISEYVSRTEMEFCNILSQADYQKHVAERCVEIFNEGNRIFFEKIYDKNESEALLLAQCMNGIMLSQTVFADRFLFLHVDDCKTTEPILEKMTKGKYSKLLKILAKMTNDELQILTIMCRMYWNANQWKLYYPEAIIRKTALEIAYPVQII